MTRLTHRVVLPEGVHVDFANGDADACPRPDKVGRYVDENAARQALATKVAKGIADPETLVVYLCACGVWHHGNRDPDQPPTVQVQVHQVALNLHAAQTEIHNLREQLAAQQRRTDRQVAHAELTKREASQLRTVLRDLTLAVARHRSRTRKPRPQDHELWATLGTLAIDSGNPRSLAEFVARGIWYRAEHGE